MICGWHAIVILFILLLANPTLDEGNWANKFCKLCNAFYIHIHLKVLNMETESSC